MAITSFPDIVLYKRMFPSNITNLKEVQRNKECDYACKDYENSRSKVLEIGRYLPWHPNRQMELPD
ncbi:predicted protein [Sclerotinia sclerotiorum 1980 UF-70]|uniref:Uncharacterized protein n=1 Tax=Sclerotinia sclerotiorum (strain ATCC 18683 / 1980 / Ss-1) TaxID=665079 RepID=A7EPG5_SCLS1|nr:predicted protein [Sclerotinia sclerotiorum 1980 UF-70]EDO04731.1 predicted protein [Sclerotinia sclerotiorum 1980 UF-70]